MPTLYIFCTQHQIQVPCHFERFQHTGVQFLYNRVYSSISGCYSFFWASCTVSDIAIFSAYISKNQAFSSNHHSRNQGHIIANQPQTLVHIGLYRAWQKIKLAIFTTSFPSHHTPSRTDQHPLRISWSRQLEGNRPIQNLNILLLKYKFDQNQLGTHFDGTMFANCVFLPVIRKKMEI